ncbi:MAG TPA: DUF397 domain-containing protein [Streptosporangiaceae bacterium]|jgi:hypothetical protein
MTDLSRARWRTSSYSGNSGNCVQVAALDRVIAVRDSKDPDGPVLVWSADEWNRVLVEIATQ